MGAAGRGCWAGSRLWGSVSTTRDAQGARAEVPLGRQNHVVQASAGRLGPWMRPLTGSVAAFQASVSHGWAHWVVRAHGDLTATVFGCVLGVGPGPAWGGGAPWLEALSWGAGEGSEPQFEGWDWYPSLS